MLLTVCSNRQEIFSLSASDRRDSVPRVKKKMHDPKIVSRTTGPKWHIQVHKHPNPNLSLPAHSPRVPPTRAPPPPSPQKSPPTPECRHPVRRRPLRCLRRQTVAVPNAFHPSAAVPNGASHPSTAALGARLPPELHLLWASCTAGPGLSCSTAVLRSTPALQI